MSAALPPTLEGSIASIKVLEEAVTVIFQNSFDADTKACLVTLMKMLDAIIQKPGDPKVRQIRLSNAAFHRKVGSRKGGLEYLQACGFQLQTSDTPLLSRHDATERVLVLAPAHEDTSRIITARRLLLTRAVQDLGMQQAELPPYRPPPKLVLSTSTNPNQYAETDAFDPYVGRRYDAQSAAVGTNLGPDASYVSHTETELQRLRGQLAALEKQAAAQPVDRRWVALKPGQALPRPSTSTGEVSMPGLSDSALLAAQLQKQQAAAHQREHGTLTTRAMRDLEKLKKQKVYSHVTLTFQFSDGCKLIGHFGSREKLATVKSQISETCLTVPTNSNTDNTRDFDLYVAPPRRLLSLTQTLQAEQLVPAAKIFVSWKVSSTPNKDAPVGSYLQPTLFQQSVAPLLFPTGQSIVADDKKKAAERSGSSKPDVPKQKKPSREDDLLRRMMGKR